MPQQHEPSPDPGFETEVKVRFNSEELDRFFDGFSPLSSPLDLLDQILGPPEPASAF